ncbi:hypothetical protein BGX21_011370 [Mortierella sp. AD011]|nr:hypothetical protein BGX20_011336 [Mortierella sp. AD010]KAF9390842.1 hypothetical protein BGX21_011370 [Mortierella sp. AD011]
MTNTGQTPTASPKNDFNSQQAQSTPGPIMTHNEYSITSGLILDPTMAVQTITTPTSAVSSKNTHYPVSNVPMLDAQTMVHANHAEGCFFPFEDQSQFPQEIIVSPDMLSWPQPSASLTEGADIEFISDLLFREFVNDYPGTDNTTRDPWVGSSQSRQHDSAIPEMVHENHPSDSSNGHCLIDQHQEISEPSSVTSMSQQVFDISAFETENTTASQINTLATEQLDLASDFKPHSQHLHAQQQYQEPSADVGIAPDGYFSLPITTCSPAALLCSTSGSGADPCPQLCDNQVTSNDSHDQGTYNMNTPEFLSMAFESATPSTAGPITPLLVLPTNPQLGCLTEANTMHLLRQLQEVQEKGCEPTQAVVEYDQGQTESHCTPGEQQQSTPPSLDGDGSSTQAGHNQAQLGRQSGQQATDQQQQQQRLLVEEEIKREDAEENEVAQYITNQDNAQEEFKSEMNMSNDRDGCVIVSGADNHSPEFLPLHHSFLQSALRNASAIVDNGAAHESVVHAQAHGPSLPHITQVQIRNELDQHRRYLERSLNQCCAQSLTTTAAPSSSHLALSSTVGDSSNDNGDGLTQEQAVQEIYQAQPQLLEQFHSGATSVNLSPTAQGFNLNEDYHQCDHSQDDDMHHEFLLLQQPLSHQSLNLLSDYDIQNNGNNVAQPQLSTVPDTLVTQQASVIQAQQQKLEELQNKLEQLQQLQAQRSIAPSDVVVPLSAIQALPKGLHYPFFGGQFRGEMTPSLYSERIMLYALYSTNFMNLNLESKKTEAPMPPSNLVHRRGRPSRARPYPAQGGKTLPGLHPSSSPITLDTIQAGGHDRNLTAEVKQDFSDSILLNDGYGNQQDLGTFHNASNGHPRMEFKHAYESQPLSIKCKVPSCTRTFASLGLLKSHMVSHQEDKPYWCDICSYDGVNPRPITDDFHGAGPSRSSSLRSASRSRTNSTDQPKALFYEVKRYKRNHDLLRHKREQHPPIEVKLQREAERIAARAARKARNEVQKKEKVAARPKGKRTKAGASAPATAKATTVDSEVVAAVQSHLPQQEYMNKSQSPTPAADFSPSNGSEREAGTSFAFENSQSHYHHQHQQQQQQQQRYHYEETSFYSSTNMPPRHVHTGNPVHHGQVQVQVQHVQNYYLSFPATSPTIQPSNSSMTPHLNRVAFSPAFPVFGMFNNTPQMGPAAAYLDDDLPHATIEPIDTSEEDPSSPEDSTTSGGTKTDMRNPDTPDSCSIEDDVCVDSESEDCSTDEEDEDEDEDGYQQLQQRNHRQFLLTRTTTTPSPPLQQMLSKGSSGGSYMGRRRKRSSLDLTDEDSDDDDDGDENGDNDNDNDDDYYPPSNRKSRQGQRNKIARHA